MNADTFLLGLVFVTEDAALFRQAQSIAIEVGKAEAVKLTDKAALVDTDECWDLRHDGNLSDVMELVYKVRRMKASSVYIIYDGTDEDLAKTRKPMLGMG